MPRSEASYASSATSASSAGTDADIRFRPKQDGLEEEGEDADNILAGSNQVLEVLLGAMHLLGRNRPGMCLRTGLLVLALEVLQLLWVLLGPANGMWDINTQHWSYRYTLWVLPRQAFLQYQGYTWYLAAMYAVFGLTLAVVAGAAYLASHAQRADHGARWQARLTCAVRGVHGLLFIAFPVGCLDLLGGALLCDWSAWPSPTLLWDTTQGSCLEMPHLVHAVAGGVGFLLFLAVAVLTHVGRCEVDTSSRHLLGCWNMELQLETTLGKAALVLLAAQVAAKPPWQAALCLLVCLRCLWLVIYKAPYFWPWVNHLWCGAWLVLVYVCALALAVAVTPAARSEAAALVRLNLLLAMLYGLALVAALGVALSWLRSRLFCWAVQRIQAAPQGQRLQEVICLHGQWQVEVMMRCLRCWDVDTGLLLPDGVAVADDLLQRSLTVITTGNAQLHLLQAGLAMTAFKDQEGARAAIARAQQQLGGFLDLYRLHLAQQALKDVGKGAEGTASITTYVEFERSYKALVSAHRAALLAQRAIWVVLLRDHVKFDVLAAALNTARDREQRATLVYRRMLMRYPDNTKLLRAYARFLEHVRHDPWSANKYYAAASRNSGTAGVFSMAAILSSLSSSDAEGVVGAGLDEGRDGIVIINAECTILAVSKGMHTMFGWRHGEMEGNNIKVIIPPPFNINHDAHVKACIAAKKETHMGDSKRALRVVAQHKDKYVFPVSLTVTRLSGAGGDTLFLGVLQPCAQQPDVLELWVSPGSGNLLCQDPRYQDWFAVPGSEVAGRPFAEQEAGAGGALQDLISRASEATDAEIRLGTMHCQAQLKHRYLGAIDVAIEVDLGGTQTMRLLVLRVRRTQPVQPLLVVDSRLAVLQAGADLADMLGYTTKELRALTLPDLLPAPYAQLHKQWLTGGHPLGKAPPLSCRAGLPVALRTRSGGGVMVRVKVNTVAAASGALTHAITVTKLTQADHQNTVCLQLKVDRRTAMVVGVNEGCLPVFGDAPASLVQRPLAALCDVFGQWEAREGAGSAVALLQQMYERSAEEPTSAWRVGVKSGAAAARAARRAQRLAASGDQDVEAQRTGRSDLFVLDDVGADGRQEFRAAALQVLATAADEVLDDAQSALAGTVTVALWDVALLSGTLVFDQGLTIKRVDPAAALLFGGCPVKMKGHSLHKYLSLPDALPASGLLQAAGRSTAMRKPAGSCWLVGPALQVAGVHADQQPLQLQLQATATEGLHSKLITARLTLVNPSCGSLAALSLLTASRPTSGLSQSSSAAASTAGAGTDSQQLRGAGRGGRAGGVGWQQAGDGRELHDSGFSHFHHAYSDSRHPRSTAELEGHRYHARSSGGGAGVKHEHVEFDQHHADLAAELEEAHASEYTMSVQGAESELGVSLSRGSSGSGDQRQPLLAPTGRAAAAGVGHRGMGTHYGRFGGADHHKQQQQQQQLQVEGVDGFRPAPATHHPVLAAHKQQQQQQVQVQVRAGALCDKMSASDQSSDVGDSMSAAEEEGGGGGRGQQGNGPQEEELFADVRRAKRLKGLLRLLTSPKSTAPRDTLWRHLLALVALLLVVHVALFVLFSTEMQMQHGYVYEVAEMGRAADTSSLMATYGIILSNCMLPRFAGTAICAEVPRYQVALLTAARNLRASTSGVYMGASKEPRALDDAALWNMWTASNTPEVLWKNTPPMRAITINSSLWQLSNALASNAEDAIHDMLEMGSSSNTSEHMQYVILNGIGGIYDKYTTSLDLMVTRAYNRLSRIRTVLTVLLAVEACGVVLVVLAYWYFLVHRAARHHMVTCTSLLSFPGATIRSLVSQPCTVDEDDERGMDREDDFETDQTKLPGAAASAAAGAGAGRRGTAGGGGGANGAGGAKATAKGASGGARTGKKGKVERRNQGPSGLGAIPAVRRVAEWWEELHGSRVYAVNGKELLPSWAFTRRCMGLLVLLEVLLVVIYALSFAQLGNLEGPISQLNSQQHVVYRNSRMRSFAASLVFSTTAADKKKWRDNLIRSSGKFAEEAHTLMYGGTLEWLSTSTRSTFGKYSPALAFTSPAWVEAFYTSDACWQADASRCAQPGTKYYEVTHHGIDTMTLRYIKEVKLLTKDADADISPNNSRYDYVWRVGGQDLYAATQAMAQRMVDQTIGKYEDIKTLHLVLLVAVVALLGAQVLLVVRPCLAVLDDQVRHLAGLLSCLPPELDVTGRLKDALDHYSVKKKEVPPLAANEDPGRAPGAPLVMGWGDAGMQRQQMLSRM